MTKRTYEEQMQGLSNAFKDLGRAIIAPLVNSIDMYRQIDQIRAITKADSELMEAVFKLRNGLPLEYRGMYLTVVETRVKANIPLIEASITAINDILVYIRNNQDTEK